ncbi:MAG: DUF1015 domain-containing protein, partial [Thermoanaerobaculia bacterium]
MKIYPFKALRPKEEYASKIASPPYDVVNTEEAKKYAKGNPLSFLHIVRAEIDLPEGTDLYSPEVYKKAGENLQKLRQEGYLIQEEKPSFYLYELEMDGRVQNGLVALVGCEDYEKGLIKIHEKTLERKEDDRVNYILGTKAHNEPVFFTYKGIEEINKKIKDIKKEKPLFDFETRDQFGVVHHRLWVVKNENDIEILQKNFEKVPCFYVADGHHRSAASYRVWKQLKEENKNHKGDEEYNWFMAVMFPKEELFIYDYNRVVKDLNNLSKDEFLEKVKEKFEVFEDYKDKKPKEPKSFGMFLDGKWYLLKAREGTFDSKDILKSLDVSILQENLLDPILGIKDPKTDKRIDFIGGILGMEEIERRVKGGWAVGFSLYPTSIDDVLKVADLGLTMPPKST